MFFIHCVRVRYTLCACCLVIFSVGRVQVLTGAADIVSWDDIIVDTAGGFSTSSGVYTVQQTGYYLTHFTAGILPFTPVTLTLDRNDSAVVPNVLMMAAGYEGEITVSRDDIQYWTAGQRVHLSSSNSLNGNSVYATSWSAVKLDNIMSPTMAFCLARTTDYPNSDSYMQFTDLMMELGCGVHCQTDRFIAPSTGIYFLSFNVAADDYWNYLSHISMQLMVNGAMTNSLLLIAVEQEYKDFASNSMLINLTENDVVQLYYEVNDVVMHFTDSHYQTALLGFRYEPVDGVKIAWHVTTQSDWVVEGLMDPLQFGYVIINEGGAWNPQTFTVTAPVSGVYWLKISGMSNMNDRSSQLDMILSVNGQRLISVVEKITQNSGNTRTHALAYHLTQGDRVTTLIPANSTLYCRDFSASFTGFLIQPDL